MVEVVRGIRYRSPGDKFFGGPIRPVPERIGPAVARNGARRETPPGSSRWEALIFRASYKIPHRPGRPADVCQKADASSPQGEALEYHISKKVIAAAADQRASRAARLCRPRGRAQSQTSLP